MKIPQFKLSYLAKAGIRFYQSLDGIKASVLMSVFGYQPVCKHNPSCSHYTIKAIEEHGTIIGLMVGFKRILTCW